MAKVTLIQVVYNSLKFIQPVYEAAFKQTFQDFEFVAIIAGNDDKGKEYIEKHFPKVKIIDPGYNIGFAKGHNFYFEQSDSEFFQLVNPDLIMTPTYVEEMLKAFEDPRVGAATGKLLRYDFTNNKATNIIDSTGVVYRRSGGGRDRGQHEIDQGQYDNQTELIGVSGAGCMYRKSALEAVKYPIHESRNRKQKTEMGVSGSMVYDSAFEYFDEDFHSYWEDVDLSLRMVNAGFKCRYAPKALAYHGRGAGSSPGGYKKVLSYIKFHSTINARIRKLNFTNHIYLFVKNAPRFYWQFFAREFFMWGFILVFETRTFGALPELFRGLKRMWQKRKWIQEYRKISVGEFERLLL